MDIRELKLPHTDPGVRSDAGLFFQGWSREGRWISGCLFNERGEVIYRGQYPKLEAELIAAQITQPARYEARRAPQTQIRYHIPVLAEM